jgi:hypothetical protein
MSKSTHFTGQPIYSQLLSLIDKSSIKHLSLKGGYDRYIKRLDGYSHLVVMLYGVLMRHESLREIVVGMLSEANKLQHLGLDYMVKRSTLSEANARRSHQFFAKVYSHLYQKYHKFLPDSRKHRSWDHLLHIMDSTTISLFSNVLKGVGRHPKSGKKKGGIKVHTLLKAQEGLPYDVHFTSAATHDHVMLRKLQLSNGSFLAMDRAYIDYKVFEQLTQQGVFYVTKMKKNQRYQEQQGCYYVNSEGRIVLKDSQVIFTKEALTHLSRKVSYWESGKAQSIVLLTNNFELPAEEIIEIYHRRWQIELLFKQLKQNFPLKYFYGESENAIKIQIWVALIANLLLSVVKRKIQRKWSFSNLATMIRQTLMSYINLYSFCEQPEKAWLTLIKARQKSPPIPTLFD